MKSAPAFWWQPRPSAAARLLQPAGHLYGALTARRMARPGTVLPVPVLCIGNLVAGGAGKTPTALAVAALLEAAGHRPAFLSRGYGRPRGATRPPAVLRVDLGRHDAAAVGDEPMLLAAAAPTYVAADRAAAGQVAVAEGATVLVLDDGLQNPRLAKTAAFAVVDAATGVGNGLCIPAGPLRAPVARQWFGVSALCLVGDGERAAELTAEASRRGKPVLRARLVPDPRVLASLRRTPLVAFAGIGRPEKFFATLAAADLAVIDHVAFPDHHVFTARDRGALLDRAANHGARLVTTSKDRTRLPPGFPAAPLPVALAFADPDRVADLLATLVGRPPPTEPAA